MSDFHYRKVVGRRMPDDHKAHEWRLARRVAAEGLYEQLGRVRVPVVVDIRDYVTRTGYDEDEIRIDITLTPVEHRNVVMQHVQHAKPAVAMPMTWTQRLRAVGKIITTGGY